jgi:hypothetical protein|eukprot:COSAG06_NODE_4074_length_4603_cov_6.326599_6_plen_76_part_00
MLLTMRRDWGNIDDVYGHCDSDFGQVELKWYIRDPASVSSAIWDGLQVIYLRNKSNHTTRVWSIGRWKEEWSSLP